MSHLARRLFGARLFVLVSVTFFSDFAVARVFDFKNENFAAYFGGTFGNSNASDSAYGQASGNDTRFDKTMSTASSGELGFLFSFSRMNLRIGAEYLMPRSLIGIKGTDANETELFSLNSKITAFVPMANLELLAYTSSTSRLLMGGGYGWAIVNLDNTYAMTAAGQTALGVGDYTESGKATAPLWQLYAGWEFLLTDTTTATFLAGYRRSQVIAFKATKDANAISRTEQSGDDLTNMTGGLRSVDLSGYFVGLNFRFYIGN